MPVDEAADPHIQVIELPEMSTADTSEYYKRENSSTAYERSQSDALCGVLPSAQDSGIDVEVTATRSCLFDTAVK